MSRKPENESELPSFVDLSWLQNAKLKTREGFVYIPGFENWDRKQMKKKQGRIFEN